jgi:hypothetical protein
VNILSSENAGMLKKENNFKPANLPVEGQNRLRFYDLERRMLSCE